MAETREFATRRKTRVMGVYSIQDGGGSSRRITIPTDLEATPFPSEPKEELLVELVETEEERYLKLSPAEK